MEENDKHLGSDDEVQVRVGRAAAGNWNESTSHVKITELNNLITKCRKHNDQKETDKRSVKQRTITNPHNE